MSPSLLPVSTSQLCKDWDQQLCGLYELSSYTQFHKADVTVLLFTGKKLSANLQADGIVLLMNVSMYPYVGFYTMICSVATK